MLPSPSSSPVRPVLYNRTNFNPLERRPEKQQQTLSFLPTPPKCRQPKRPAQHIATGGRKRIKLDDSDDEDCNSSESDSACGSDAQPSHRVAPPRRRAPVHARVYASTRSILQSFVSSQRQDRYICHSADLAVPPIYCSSYSHGAKRGEKALLAVGSERGSIQIINTTRRDQWDLEPKRIHLQPHNNGIFDVKWDKSDTRLATCSGDQSIRITSVETSDILSCLRGHSGTTKCISWDPTHADLLSTGGRDGNICLWDVRIVGNNPVAIINGAHGNTKTRKKTNPIKTVTDLVYSDLAPYHLISSGTSDGILRCWDIRFLQSKKRAPKPKAIIVSLTDPTCLHGSRRPRGIKSLYKGSGPTASLLFGFSTDSRVHTYSMTNSFYVGLSVSPCGKWLACGGPTGNAFLFDVHNAAKYSVPMVPSAVQLCAGQKSKGEIGSVDWSSEGIATSSDEGVVRVWRPDLEVYRRCLEDPMNERWHWDWPIQKNVCS